MSFTRLKVCLHTGAHRSFLIHCGVCKFLKDVAINLPPIKHNEINVFHLDVQKHVPYTRPRKRFLISYWLYLETVETYFKLYFMICFCQTKF